MLYFTWKLELVSNSLWIFVDNYTNDKPIGCFLEVDLDDPDESHVSYNNYPLVDKKKMEVKKEMLSHYQLEII